MRKSVRSFGVPPSGGADAPDRLKPGLLARPASSSLWAISFLLLTFFALPLLADDPKPVSYFHEIVPIFKRSCTGCHHPGKLKGGLDLTVYQAFKKGGKTGPSFVSGDPKKSQILDEISGDEPSMPKEGDPLSRAEIALIERWIIEGAKDDTPAGANSFQLTEPPVYAAAPVISALAYSPDGNLLAVSGYHEVLLHKSDGSELMARLVGESPRVESIAFSSDGKLLAVAGSAPARFGEVQIWDPAKHELIRAVKVSHDSVYGVSFSPDSTRIAVGCADKTVRMLSVQDGKELLHFDNHSDWVLGTTFTVDGKRLLSGSRDRAMKLIDASSSQFIDDINKLLEEVMCLARHPKLDQVAYGGALGTPRLYRISDNQGRTAANNDVNLVREFERQPGPIYAMAFNSDGSLLAAGGASSEVRLYKTSDGKRAATLKGFDGAIFSLAFHPQKTEIVCGGFDGKGWIFDAATGNLIRAFVPVPIKAEKQVAAAPR